MTNRADDLGAVEQGQDLGELNRSGLPASSPILDVRVENRDGHMTVIPMDKRPARRLELRESETALLTAQLTEDPEMTAFSIPGVGEVQTSGSRLARAVSRNQNREELVWFGIDSHNLSAALGDRIIVRRDSLESEYVCRSCRGKGHTSEVCKLCDGRQQKNGMHCGACKVTGFDAEATAEWHPSGFTRCTDCNGTGWRNGIIIPEVAQGKPVTGVVVSLGPETKLVKLGDRVLHSKYSGHTLEMKAETYTYMRESEVISLLRDL